MKMFFIAIIVFVSGFVLMSFEILGSRILAPFFGQTTYTWGALISVLLTALAFGYYWGGRLADYRSNFAVMSLILLLPSVYLPLIPLFSQSVCRFALLRINGERLGVLIAAFILFFLPASFLGMLAPYTVKLAVPSLDFLGRNSGIIFAISAAGNISGTLITSFFLIGILRTSWTVCLLGIPCLLGAAGAIIYHNILLRHSPNTG